MSDNFSFSMIVTEGVHDVQAVSKLLRLKGFQETKTLSHIPRPLQDVIPRTYPWKGGGTELTWLVTHPSFFSKEDYFILVSNAGGETNLGRNLKELLSALRKQYIDAALRGVAMLTDADIKSCSEKTAAVCRDLAGAFHDSEDFAFSPSSPEQLMLFGRAKPFSIYVFPNSQDSGTLEHVLIDGAKNTYPALLEKAEEYVSYAQKLPYGTALTNNFNGRKAVVGVVSNALRPGRANQVSIHDDDWFTLQTLSTVPSHRALSGFIDSIINWK